MNHAQLIDIANAKTHIEAALDLEKRFLAHAAAHGVPAEVPTQLKVDGPELSVAWFSVEATAVGRLARDSVGDFAIEYVFFVPKQEDRVEVWRGYLRPDGRISEGVDGSVGVCDYNNTYIAKHICGRVVLGILNSSIYSPA